MLIESIIFYLLLIDSICAAGFSLAGKTNWWYDNFRPMARMFPLIKGWAVAYFILVLFIGWILWQTGALVTFW